VGNILLLENEPSVITFLCSVLQPLGHNILLASSVEEAFHRFDEADASVDLLIAEINWPGTSGIRVALEFRGLLPNLRTILTTQDDPNKWGDQETAELDEYPSDSVTVVKVPLDPEILLYAVRRFVAEPSRFGIALAKAG
jgi:CheY-like chemotaxis protein